MKFWSRFWLSLWIIIQLAGLPGSLKSGMASSAQQADAARQKAQALMVNMTPEERIGQLFLITFQGSTFDENSQIYDLVANYHIGGVVLLRSNDNFSSTDNAPAQAYQLTRLLQESEWKSSRRTNVNPDTGASFNPQYIPILIGLSQEGDQYPNDQIINGLTDLPNLMAIGATWDPTLAQEVGTVMGRELSALGFNLYMGPSLDVLADPQYESGDDLGVRTFGGSPYWAGKLGQAYVKGLHLGSSNRMAVIPKHFPGRGGSDRAPEEEIPTVRKSLEQLLQMDLAPFFAVTGGTAQVEMKADGLLVSHIRYQGLQGNVRGTTRPLSADSAAMDLLLQQTPISQWRTEGGLLVSDNLGSQAIRRFYDPTGGAFDARMVAREAFMAGNDLLFVDRFISTYDPDTYTTVIKTLESFAQKYREDNAFAQRVDASVERILTLKYRLYPEFNLASVVPQQDRLAEIGAGQQIGFDVARRAVTLISPSAAELQTILPRPPEARERVVFLTDVQAGRQCSTCADQMALDKESLQNAVLRLYGPRAGGLVSQNLMSSYSFNDLLKYLNRGGQNGTEDIEPNPIESDLQVADWVVVSILKPNPNLPDSYAFHRLLSQRPELIRNKKVLVFAFNAPYYLDATDISKVTAYYAVYGKTVPFVEAAARILFQEQSVATGALPVSVPGVGYDLDLVTAPQPTQVIPIVFDVPRDNAAVTQPGGTIEPTPAPLFRVEDVIPLRTGTIYDYNQNPVPDGTRVRFVFNVLTENGSTQKQVETETFDGVARTSYRIKDSGILEIQALTDNGARTPLLRLDTVTGGVTQVAPTPQPTETPEPTVTPTTTPTVTPTVTPTPLPPSVGFTDWFYVTAMLITGALGVAYLGVRQTIARWGLRWALCGVIGGLLAYNYIAMGFPGSEVLLKESGTPGVLVVTFLGITVGWGIGWLWRQFEFPLSRPSDRAAGERPVTGPRSQSG